MISQMSQREKMLAFIIGGAVAVLLNVVLIKFFIGKFNESRMDRLRSEGQLEKYRRQESERDKWARRDAWLTQQLTVLDDSDVANKHRREALQELAKKHEVIVESISPGVAIPQPYYTSLAARLECKGKWDENGVGLGSFLIELQAPGNFIVIENLELKVDSNDKSQMKASLSIAKWFAPKS